MTVDFLFRCRIVLLAAAAGAVVGALVGCGPRPGADTRAAGPAGAAPAAAPEPPAPGTRIRLVLLNPIASDDVVEGDRVDFLVAEPVAPGLPSAVAAGSSATAVVVQARGGSVGGSLLNQPPRLAIRLEHLNAGPGREIVPLRAVEGQGEDAVLEFRRGDGEAATNPVVEAMRDPSLQLGTERIREAIATGTEIDLADPVIRAAWNTLADEPGHEAMRDLAAGRSRLDFGDLKARAATGRLALDDAAAALGLAQALTIARTIAEPIGRALTAPQIRIPAGTVVEAEVAG